MKQLDRMLYTLHDRGFLTLEPAPAYVEPVAGEPPTEPSFQNLLPQFQTVFAKPTEKFDTLLAFRACHPLYGAFLVERLGAMNREERIQAFESVLELPRPLLKFTRVPFAFKGGTYTSEVLDPELVARGLLTAKAEPVEGEETDDDEFVPWDERPPLFAEKLKLLFDALNPDVTDVNIQAVWAAGEVLQFAGNFNAFISSKDLAKQEGIIFRHLLRLILLTDEFAELTPPGIDPNEWKDELREHCRDAHEGLPSGRPGQHGFDDPEGPPSCGRRCRGNGRGGRRTAQAGRSGRRFCGGAD